MTKNREIEKLTIVGRLKNIDVVEQHITKPESTSMNQNKLNLTSNAEFQVTSASPNLTEYAVVITIAINGFRLDNKLHPIGNFKVVGIYDNLDLQQTKEPQGVFQEHAVKQAIFQIVPYFRGYIMSVGFASGINFANIPFEFLPHAKPDSDPPINIKKKKSKTMDGVKKKNTRKRKETTKTK